MIQQRCVQPVGYYQRNRLNIKKADGKGQGIPVPRKRILAGKVAALQEHPGATLPISLNICPW